jgi:hypothetical protein
VIFVFKKKLQIIFSKVVNKNKYNTMMFDLMEILIFLVKKKKKKVVYIIQTLTLNAKMIELGYKPSSN